MVLNKMMDRVRELIVILGGETLTHARRVTTLWIETVLGDSWFDGWVTLPELSFWLMELVVDCRVKTMVDEWRTVVY